MDEIPFEGPQPGPQPRPIRRGVKPAAWKILVYGVPGIGKSTLAMGAPSPYFLDLEGGINQLDVAATPRRLTTLSEVFDEIRWFWGQNEFQTLVVDSIGELERMLEVQVLAQSGKTGDKSVADIPYGRGGDLLVAAWCDLLDRFDRLSEDAGKNVLFTGHEAIQTFENPSDANYSFHTLNVHKKTAPKIFGRLDGVFFARYETFVTGADAKGKGKATGQGRRVLQTQERPSWKAKTRWTMPEVVPLDKNIFNFIK